MDAITLLKQLKNRRPSLYSEKKVKKYAVLLPLLEKNDETHLLFEVRSLNLRNQPGDVCFPGGGIEPKDPSKKHAALRETAEELGISQDDIHDVYPLDVMMPTPERLIYPFVGRLEKNIQLRPNKAEVSKTFTIPLNYFVHTKPKKYEVSLKAQPENGFPYHLIVGGENYDWRVHKVNQYFYLYEGQVIWGLTAKIILNFLSLLEINP